MLSSALIALGLSVSSVLAAPATGAPVVQLGGGSFSGAASGQTHKFLGIPFAQPPVGDLRYRLPQPISGYNGSYDASSYGPSCIQQSVQLPIVQGLVKEAADYIVNSIFGQVFPDSEDCLTLNVVKPAGATPASKLPVIVWIFGGGFQLGSTSMYDGGLIVSRSISMGSPVVYVSMNYRLSGLGFLAGKEVKDAQVGNLGLQDQREALRWIQKYITQFGGDPTKVTIWGESAGAISAALHMVANDGNTEGLFRAAFMQSGAPIPVGDLTRGQKHYDDLVRNTGCSRSSDTLACLRTIPYTQLKAAINKSPGIFSYQSLNLAWIPRSDGVFIKDDPLKLVQQGKVAKIPYVTGNCDDEGTLFSLSTLNVTTESQVKSWVQNNFLSGVPTASIDRLAQLYPSDITQGSPFGTGIFNALTPQFKRLAAFQGDGVFQAPRRWLLKNTVGSNPNVWVYVSRKFKALPILGSVHAHDILNVYAGGEMGEHLIRFANKLDPNSYGLFSYRWPKYDLKDKRMLVYEDGLTPLDITTDTYRSEAMDYLIDVTLVNPV